MDESSGRQSWADVRIRPMAPTDIRRCAELRALSDELSLEQSISVVTQWLEPRPDRTTLVAVQRGSLHGYGRTAFLDPPADGGDAPVGWYLAGIVVDPAVRRRGIADLLTRERLRRLADVTDEAWFFANARNRASISLHERLGFTRCRRDFSVPGVTFAGGVGVLYRTDL